MLQKVFLSFCVSTSIKLRLYVRGDLHKSNDFQMRISCELLLRKIPPIPFFLLKITP